MIAAIYARKSTDQSGVTDEEKSVTRQIEHGKAYAVRKGWVVADEHIYVDDGISGAEFVNRPGFLRLMNALKPRPPFQVLIMSEESRLGREMVDTMGALKQLVTVGVRVFYYMTDSERTLDSPIEKAMMALETFGAELEREKARQRTADAMAHKARAGHVTGGRVFGYDNVEVLGEPDSHGRRPRLHVERRINEREAAVVRRIFELCAQGHGMKQITYQLNAAGAVCPRPQQGRPAGWSPSSIRSMLYRPLYRGELVWNRSRKRDQWGQVRPHARPDAEWLRQPAPELRIVADEQWEAAHARLGEARALYLRGTDGQLWGHPARGTESKYLLVGLATCGACGGGLSVRSRSHGRRRASYYVCTAYHTRGHHVCANAHELPMEAMNEAVLGALGEQVLSPQVVQAAVARARDRLLHATPDADVQPLREALASVERELTRLTAALATGADLPTVVEAIREREARKVTLKRRLEAVGDLARVPLPDPQHLEAALRQRLEDWRGLLGRHVAQARQMLRKLIVGRLVVTPDGRYAEVTGTGTLGKFFSGIMCPKGMASPRGFEPVF